MGLNTFFPFENYHFLGYDLLSLRWNQSILLECQYISTSLHGAISQRTIFFILTVVRTLGLIFWLASIYTVFTHVIHARWMAEGGHSLTPTGKIRWPSIELMCSWIVRAWDMVDQRIIVTSFLKTGISNAVDGSEDYVLWKTEENVDEES